MAVSGADIVRKAQQSLGVKYVWGGDSLTNGIDCSGLVQQVYASYGIQLPRVTYDQINQGASVSVDKLAPGDLVFFDTDKSRTGPDHVGIYIGGGKFIHAPKPGDSVKISSLTDSFYMQRWMGGRRISGVEGGGAVAGNALNAEAAQQASVPKLSADELADQYGMSYAFFKSQPELMGLLKGAVAGQWTADVFTAHLRNTKWWSQNSASARKSQVQAKTDPATYKASIGAATAAANDAAVKLGAILTTTQLNQLAKNMVDYEWNEAQVSNFLGQYVGFQKDHTLGGQAGAAARQITQTAYDNGIQISDQTVKNHAALLVRGLTNMTQIQDGLRGLAMSMYPGFANQLQAGASMRDIAQPYIQMTAQELGLPETDIDLWHPKVRAAIQQADTKGQPAPMNLGDFRSTLRSDPAWKATPGALSATMATGRQVLSSMGLIGG